MVDTLSAVQKYQYFNLYTSLNTVGHKSTTELGDRSTINTPLGEMRIWVKFDEKTILYLDNLAQLASFDTNEDRFLILMTLAQRILS